jgi:hypothetical protein
MVVASKAFEAEPVHEFQKTQLAFSEHGRWVSVEERVLRLPRNGEIVFRLRFCNLLKCNDAVADHFDLRERLALRPGSSCKPIKAAVAFAEIAGSIWIAAINGRRPFPEASGAGRAIIRHWSGMHQ